MTDTPDTPATPPAPATSPAAETPAPAEARITVSKNGPYRIEGNFTIVDPEGNAYGLGGRTVISLCRCGLSNNKPFCDGTHRHHGFMDDPAARDLPPKAS